MSFAMRSAVLDQFITFNKSQIGRLHLITLLPHEGLMYVGRHGTIGEDGKFGMHKDPIQY